MTENISFTPCDSEMAAKTLQSYCGIQKYLAVYLDVADKAGKHNLATPYSASLLKLKGPSKKCSMCG